MKAHLHRGGMKQRQVEWGCQYIQSMTITAFPPSTPFFRILATLSHLPSSRPAELSISVFHIPPVPHPPTPASPLALGHLISFFCAQHLSLFLPLAPKTNIAAWDLHQTQHAVFSCPVHGSTAQLDAWWVSLLLFVRTSGLSISSVVPYPDSGTLQEW